MALNEVLILVLVFGLLSLINIWVAERRRLIRLLKSYERRGDEVCISHKVLLSILGSPHIWHTEGRIVSVGFTSLDINTHRSSCRSEEVTLRDIINITPL